MRREWSHLQLTFLMLLLQTIIKQSTPVFNSRHLSTRGRIACKMSETTSSFTPTLAMLSECDAEGIRSCGATLKAGGLVAFPTETVYGLGANALNDSSVKSIFAAKKRPSTDPLIVHILGKEDIYDLFDFDGTKAETSKAQLVCEHLAASFWPGPLTIIFKAKANVPMSVTAGTGFVGLRSPKHPIARQLLAAAGLPIAAPSANRFGHVSPTSADHVMQDLGLEKVTILKDDVSLSGGCTIGIESTVCRVSGSGDVISILRCGAVTSEDIIAALAGCELKDLADVSVVVENEKALIKKTPVAMSSDSRAKELESSDDQTAAVAPGQMIKHYAPDIPTYIIRANSGALMNRLDDVLCVVEDDVTSATAHSPVSSTPTAVTDMSIRKAFVIDFGGQLKDLERVCSVYCDLSAEGKPEEACNRIFEVLRKAEDSALSVPVQSTGLGEGVRIVLLPDLRELAERSELVRALWERLHRAASGTFVVTSSK